MLSKKKQTKKKASSGFRISVGSDSTKKQYQPIDYSDLYTAFKLHADVFACVEQWKAGVLASGWDIIYKDDENPDEAGRDKLINFFEKPNPDESMSELLNEIVMHLGVSGDAYWNIVFNALGEPIELWGLHPATMQIRGTEHGEVVGYTQKYQGEEHKFEPQEIAHFRLPNPLNDWYGLSPLYACIWEVETDLAALWSNYHFFKNDAMPPTVWTLPKEMNDEEYKNAKQVILNEFQGVKNKHRTAVVKGDIELKSNTPTMKDMEFLQSRKLATEKICAAYKVPKVMIGYTDSANYNTSLTMERTFYQVTIQPLQQLIEYIINNQIIPLFGIDTCRFKFKPTDFTEREITFKEALDGVKIGMYSINEARTKLGDQVLDEKIFGNLGNVHFVSTTQGMVDLQTMFGQSGEKALLQNLVNIKALLQERYKDERDTTSDSSSR